MNFYAVAESNLIAEMLKIYKKCFILLNDLLSYLKSYIEELDSQMTIMSDEKHEKSLTLKCFNQSYILNVLL